MAQIQLVPSRLVNRISSYAKGVQAGIRANERASTHVCSLTNTAVESKAMGDPKGYHLGGEVLRRMTAVYLAEGVLRRRA